MLARTLLVLVAGLVTAQLLSALPLDTDSLQTDTLLKQESEQLTSSLESSDGAPVVREKRTIGFLRQLFPTLSQIIDRKIQSITRLLFRLIGRLVLRGGGGGGGGGGGDSSDDDSERRVQITLPTFPPSADDEDEEDEDSTGSDDSTTTTTEPSADENAVAESKVAPVIVRKTRQAPAAAAEEEEEYEDDDLGVAASNDNEVAQSAEEDGEVDSESAETDDQRDKRFSSGAAGAGSGGGSGNFLFDIIRLVAGSGTTQSQDEADNAPLDENTTHTGEAKHDDGYSAGVPGPLTRLFVIANRGIANLIQDLILRLAQTSERIVNFKARLITSII
ncbi:uncharacterized protein LOC128990148 isoform X1 [Macrosteles quadrilineatus]|uniref:uncharacterized protein LOC128990148 isoform X1 n=1 Tax=Macrosteles quadrilineatus TaxID=74068 RepID=UPI0023E18672|nr:uncharacterized protein LOC128990148 isoform X1 [Macrosteles quadrilineatus]